MTDTKDSADVVLRLPHPAPSGDIVVTFGRLLRQLRERQGLTQERAAELTEVSRATFTQWETGRHMPSAGRTAHLDRLLEAEGELVAAAAGARTRPAQIRPVPSAPERPAGRPLGQILRNARRALLGQLQYDGDGRALGWRHNLVESEERVTPVSTTYALKALALLGGPTADTSAVADRVLTAGRDDDGHLRGWKASSQSTPRMETTGTAFDSLQRAGFLFDADEVIRVLQAQFEEDETARQRPFVLTAGLPPLLRVAPDAPFTATMVETLLDCRREFDGALLWPEKLVRREQPMLDASLAHTARAVAVLRDAPEHLVGDAVTVAEQWIAEQTNLGGVTEIIRRTREDGGREEISIHHFTSALIVSALAGSDRPDTGAITRALGVVWERYDPTHSLWVWGNGDVPPWMLGDAVDAVREAAFATTTTPVPQGTAPVPHEAERDSDPG